MIRNLAGAVQDDDFFDLNTEISALMAFCGEHTLLSWILNSLIGYNYQNATIKDRARVAIYLCARAGQSRAASLVLFLLPQTHDISSMCRYTDPYGRTLLHTLSWALGEQLLRVTQSSKACHAHQQFQSPSRVKAEADSCQDILSLMSELVVAGANLHTCTKGPCCANDMSSLMCILSSFSYLRLLCLYDQDEHFAPTNPEINALHMLPVPAVVDVVVPVILWLEMPYNAGVDLIKYGQKEKELRHEGRTTSYCSFAVWPWDFMQPQLINTGRRFENDFWISFSYGPNPSDWQFWLIEEIDD